MFGRKKKASPDTVAGVRVGRLREEVEVGGFNLGVIVDDVYRQATMQFEVREHAYVTETQWREWESHAGRLPRVIALFTTDVAGGVEPLAPRAGAVFHAEDKSDRKDVDNFVARLLVDGSPIFSQADAVGLTSTPLDMQGVIRATAESLHSDVDTWSDLAKIELEEKDADLRVNNSDTHTTFVIPADADLMIDEIDEIMDEWEGDVPLRRTRIFRPLIVADADTDDELAGGGRRHILLTVGGGQEGATALVESLSPASQVSLRRCWCRQKGLFISALGLGVLGFQRSIHDAKRPDAA